MTTAVHNRLVSFTWSIADDYFLCEVKPHVEEVSVEILAFEQESEGLIMDILKM
jgi:hypothetical protein